MRFSQLVLISKTWCVIWVHPVFFDLQLLWFNVKWWVNNKVDIIPWLSGIQNKLQLFQAVLHNNV